MARRPDYANQMTDKELADLERRISAIYQEARDSLDETVRAYFERFRERDEEMKKLIGTIQNGREWTEQDYLNWRLAQIGRGERFKALRDKVAERMTKANETATAYVNDATPGIYSLNRNYAAYTIERATGDVGFDLWDEQTVKRLIVEQPGLMPYYPPMRALRRGIDLAWGKKQITACVTSSILQGKSIKGMADDLQTRIPEMNRASAIRTARTAVTGAQNAGRMDSYHAAEKMGIRMKKEWLATLDNRTRHAHAMLDGQKAEVGKPFKVDGEEIRFPGDPTAAGYLVYNCRCTLVAAVDGVDTSDAQRWARDPATGRNAIVENITYKEWEKRKLDLENGNNSGKIVLNKSSNTRLRSDADPMADAFGAGVTSHPQEIQQFKDTLKELGVELIEREKEALGYSPSLSRGKPGTVYISKEASYSAWLHEMQHVMDDRDAGWVGMRVIADPAIRYEWELRAYNIEIELAIKSGRQDIAKKLLKNLEEERRKIYGESAD